MIKSMTGFGRAQVSSGPFQTTVEMRSVNHRYADLRVKLPADMGALEEAMQERLKKVVQRGRLDVTINVARRSRGSAPIEVDAPLIDSYIQAARRIQKRHRLAGELSLDTVMRLPDVIRPRDVNGAPGAGQEALVMKAFVKALAAHDAMRVREGKILERDIMRRMKAIDRLRERMEKRAPDVVPAHMRRLLARLNGAEARVDEARLAQEVALAAEKADITEELVRLSGYIEQAGEILKASKEPIGKKLDFIMQEMNREANTINSKAVDLDLCRDALEVKAEVEKIREQVQNIE